MSKNLPHQSKRSIDVPSPEIASHRVFQCGLTSSNLTSKQVDGRIHFPLGENLPPEVRPLVPQPPIPPSGTPHLAERAIRYHSGGQQAESGPLARLVEQRQFSNRIARELGGVIHEAYPAMTDGIDIGSYSRGTNLDAKPDIDIMFLGMPHDTEQGYVDWTTVNTYHSPTRDGISELQQIRAMDTRLAQVIERCTAQLGSIGENPQFNWLRAWGEGMVFNISVTHPQFGHMDFDVNMYSTNEYFGVEHARRFNHYVDDVASRYGATRAAQLLEDIKTLKKLVKTEATVDGKIDKAKKVPGVLIEALFTAQDAPPTYEQLIQTLSSLDWSQSDAFERSPGIGHQREQLVGKVGDANQNRTLASILHSPALTQGGYHSLKKVLSSEYTRLQQKQTSQTQPQSPTGA